MYINLYKEDSNATSTNNVHRMMSWLLSEELALTPLVAVQVMVAKALSLITVVPLRVLVTLSKAMKSSVELVMTRMRVSLKSIPFKNQEMVGAGTPVAMHISAPEAPSEMFTVGFWESKMAATGATGGDEIEEFAYKTKACRVRKVLTHPTLVAQWSCWSTLQHSLLNRCKCQCPLQWC